MTKREIALYIWLPRALLTGAVLAGAVAVFVAGGEYQRLSASVAIVPAVASMEAAQALHNVPPTNGEMPLFIGGKRCGSVYHASDGMRLQLCESVESAVHRAMAATTGRK